jgi:4-oxalmesaconate hydratase
MLNPDPAEGTGYVPPMGDEYWYPLYEKLVAMDVPALVHTAGCRNERESYSNHFITEEGIAILSLIDHKTFDTFPNLKLMISHAGGPIPYQIGRWRAQYIGGMAGPRGHTDTFDDQLRKMYFDTCVYNVEALDLEFKICGPDRCLFGTEKPGTGSSKDPKTGVWLDDTKPVIESISWLTEQDKRNIFEENCRKLYTRLKVPSRA